MADKRIRPEDVATPTSITLVRRDPLADIPRFLDAKARVRAFIEAVSLVSSTRRDADKVRPDVVTRQQQSDSTVFTKNPVPRGNLVTDHSIRMPTVVQFTGVITETPFIAYTSQDLGVQPGINRVSDYLRQLYEFYERRDPLYMASSIRTINGMAISKLSVGKGQDTGEAVEVSMTLQQILFVDEVRDEPIPETLASQLGAGEASSSVNTIGASGF